MASAGTLWNMPRCTVKRVSSLPTPKRINKYRIPPTSTIVSGAMPICWKRSINSIGTTAAAKATLSRSGTPGPLSKSGSMPETPHSPPASTQAGNGTSYIDCGRRAVGDAQHGAGRDVGFESGHAKIVPRECE